MFLIFSYIDLLIVLMYLFLHQFISLSLFVSIFLSFIISFIHLFISVFISIFDFIHRKNVIELDVFFQQMNHIVVEQIPARTFRDIYSKSLPSQNICID